jgi:threonine aldolase
MVRHDFNSDNVAGAMPEVIEALGRFNSGFEAAYGDDGVSARAADLIRGMLDADAEVWFAASGTAANSLCLASLAKPHEAVLAHRHSHVASDETGAPAFFGGGLAVLGLAGASGRIDPAAVRKTLARGEDPHWQFPAVLSLTHANEYGGVQPETELAALTALARDHGLKVHLDGARLANAVGAGFDPKAVGRLGIDTLVLGGTKVGSTPTEAIVLLDKSLGAGFAARLKHAGQLVSKARFLAAPWIGMLEHGAWRARAAHANAMARGLAAAMPFEIRHPVEANAVFADIDAPRLAALHAAGWWAHRVYDGSVRFMCSWATTQEAVDELAAALKNLV